MTSEDIKHQLIIIISARFVQWVEDIYIWERDNMVIKDFVFIAPLIIILNKRTDFYEWRSAGLDDNNVTSP